MSDSNDGCVYGGLISFVTTAIIIGSGFLSWKWIEPDSFGLSIVFLLVWGILAKVGHFIALIAIGIMTNNEN